MCRFIESIKLIDGEFLRLNLHQARVEKVFKDYFPLETPFSLSTILQNAQFSKKGIYKCRIVFNNQVQLIEFIPYSRREIKSLKLVEADIESLPYKKEDRTKLNDAYTQRGDCDDIVIVINGNLTDSLYANIALWDGKKWYTPSIPLIYGVQRASLLSTGEITERNITISELSRYRLIRLFNAMIEFGEIELNVNFKI